MGGKSNSGNTIAMSRGKTCQAKAAKGAPKKAIIEN